MDNLKWWITLSPSQKVNALMAIIVLGLGYALIHQDKYYNALVSELKKELKNAITEKDSALNVARIVEIEALKREVKIKEESLEEQKKSNEKNAEINEAQKKQLANNEAYANQLLNILNTQKKINSAQ